MLFTRAKVVLQAICEDFRDTEQELADCSPRAWPLPVCVRLRLQWMRLAPWGPGTGWRPCPGPVQAAGSSTRPPVRASSCQVGSCWASSGRTCPSDPSPAPQLPLLSQTVSFPSLSEFNKTQKTLLRGVGGVSSLSGCPPLTSAPSPSRLLPLSSPFLPPSSLPFQGLVELCRLSLKVPCSCSSPSPRCCV